MVSATNNFSQSAQIGQGGYGKVYKGNLHDGTVVAIKRAQEGSLQGEREFLTEIQLLSRLHHRNLVSLIGYCDEDGEQVTLVFKVHKCKINKFLLLISFSYFSFLSYIEKLLISISSIYLFHIISMRIFIEKSM